MADIVTKAIKLAAQGPHKTMPTPRLIQLLFNGAIVAKSTEAVYVWEHRFYPTYYLPLAAFDKTYIHHGSPTVSSTDSSTEIGSQLTITVGEKSTSNAFAFNDTLPEPATGLAGLVTVAFDAMDRWFEEANPVFVHPKDPFKRIDILNSTRRVRVFVDGECVADAPACMHLYETGLPVRFYLPRTALVQDVLRPSATKTKCPYKGEAEYHSVQVNGKLHEDVVWYYDNPTLESALINGLCCFYNEKVDIELDGQMLARPDTHFGRKKPGEKPSI